MSCCQVARTIPFQNVKKCDADNRRNSQANILLSGFAKDDLTLPMVLPFTLQGGTSKCEENFHYKNKFLKGSWWDSQQPSRQAAAQDFRVGCITAPMSCCHAAHPGEIVRGVTEFFATTFYFTTQSSNRPRNLSYELPDGTSSLLAPNVSTRKLCSSQDASGIHDNSSFMSVTLTVAMLCAPDVVLSSSTTCSKGIFEHVPRILSARSCVLVGVFFRELF